MNGTPDASVQTILDAARDLIRLEAAALTNLVDQVDQSTAQVVGMILAGTGKVITTGTGTSGIMAERLSHLLAVTGTPAFYLPCLDALHGGMGSIAPSDLVIAFSKGGKSAELTQLVTRLEERGIRVVAVTESPASEFAAAASHVVTITTDPAEADLGGLVATGSTLVAGAWGDALVAVLMSARQYSWEEVISTHPGGIVGQQDTLPARMRLDPHTGPAVAEEAP
ncbi:SIS domain-containing protein [Streptomyces paludis]|uniref:SIS domain-containing protein n=1 Tax=Streptomyces paludis TaxID=2282738 RepID=A0A345HY82_9ACTN|nr:SIS domain-containing protein [Streptomyces paludis]AXG81656.1 SIS domain-containing protein [Streptomyces paludis]